MEKSCSALDDGATSSYHTVFIDTTLDTHLALIVSDSDTVSDLKKKIMDEHPLCFPDIGGINIHALKVKRRGYFYHLSDSMLVRSAFHGVRKSWFVSVEASSVGEQSGNLHLGKPDAGDIVPHFGITNKPSADSVDLLLSPRKLPNIDDSYLQRVQGFRNAKQKPAADHNADNHCNVLSLETNNSSDPGLPVKHGLHSKEYEDPLRHNELKEDSSRNVTGDAQVDVSLEGSSKNGSVAKKKRKTKTRSGDEVHSHALKEDNASARVSVKDASHLDNAVPDNSLLHEDRGKVVTHNMESGSKYITDELCRISSSDANKRPGSEIQTNEVLREGTAVPGKHIEHEKCTSEKAVLKDQCHMSLQEASLGPTVKKKWKTVRKDDRVLICDSTKETSNPGDKQKSTNTTLDHVSSDFYKAGHLLTASPSSGKKKRKMRSSKSVSQFVATVPSFAEHDRGESSLDTEGVHEKLEREPDAAVVPGQNVQAAMACEPSSISMKEHGHPHVPVQEEGENNKVTSSFDGDVRATDALNEEPGKSSKKKKKSKKSRDNVASGAEDTSSLVGISSPGPIRPEHKDHSSDKSRKEESILSPIKGIKESKTTVNTSILATERETDNVIRNVLESLEDISKNSVEAENRDEKKSRKKNRDEKKSRKKTKRKGNLAAKNLPDLQKEDKDVSCKNATSSINDITAVEVDASSELTKKTKLVDTNSEHQLNRSNWEHENKAAIETNPEGNNEGKPIQALNGNFLKSGSTDEANNHMEVSCESDRTIVNDNFVPSQHKQEISAADEMLVEKVSKTKGADNVVKAGKDKRKLEVHTNGLKLNENQGNGGETQAFKSSTVEPERSLTKGHADSSKLQAKIKLPKVSGIDARVLPSNKPDKVDQKPEEATRASAVSASGLHNLNKNKETVAASSSSLGGSKSLLPRSKKGNGHQSHVEMGKFFRNNENGELVNSSKPKKSLLAKSGTIFKDDSGGSSDDEDGPENSDSSTIAPSDNSLSSSYSDGDSTARQNGTRKESARTNILKANSSLKLHTIIRSSSGYKASKLTASQSQLQDTESQPVEFVPDSQEN